MSFAGFSEDDIKKLKNGHTLTKAGQVTADSNKSQGKQFKKVTFKNSSKPVTDANGNKHLKTDTLSSDVPPEAKPVKQVPDSFDVEIKGNQSDKTSEEVIKLANEVPKQAKHVLDLNEFESRQKLIEEQNRKRKELLAKALADRTRQTQEEQQRLNQIQSEFKKLDALLSNDVKILRKRIEMASFDYMEAQKKYDRVEKEFLEAKVMLHQKREKKEMLTEHLYAIIEKNEERKAEKLTELLQKLQIDLVTSADQETTKTKPDENLS